MEINMFYTFFLWFLCEIKFERVWNWSRQHIYLNYLSILWIVLRVHSVLIMYSLDTFGNCLNNFGSFRVHFDFETIGSLLSDSRFDCILILFYVWLTSWLIVFADTATYVLVALSQESIWMPCETASICYLLQHVILENNDDDGCLSFSHVAHVNTYTRECVISPTQ